MTTQPTTDTTRTEREKAWARQVRTSTARRMAQARIDQRRAERDLVEALKTEPWVRALAAIGAAKHRAAATAAEDREAARLLGEHVPAERTADPSVASYFDGKVLPEFLARPVARAADAVAGELAATERAQREAERARALEDEDLLDQARTDDARAATDPLYDIDRRPRVEVTETNDAKGRKLYVHRDLDTGDHVIVDVDGNVVPPAQPEPSPGYLPPPPTWAGGPQVWPPDPDTA